MSYDFMMAKLSLRACSIDDFNEHTMLEQDPAVLMAGLSAMEPGITWNREADGDWYGMVEGEDGTYRFHISAESDVLWTVRTSHWAATRRLIPRICATLGVAALDGQKGVIIDATGERPALPADGDPACRASEPGR
jgi:hypothetical protein